MGLGEAGCASEQNAPAGLHGDDGTGLCLVRIPLLVGATPQVVTLINDADAEWEAAQALQGAGARLVPGAWGGRRFD